MTTANEYNSSWLQIERPQPMYDKKINKLVNNFIGGNYKGPNEHGLIDEFKKEFNRWVFDSKYNNYSGVSKFPVVDICYGCTHFIDSLYMEYGKDNIQIIKGDYKYHERLNPNIKYVCVDNLRPKTPLIISLPFPSTGDIHKDMNDILNKSLDLDIPVYIDGAWATCSSDIKFDFSHPSIKSFAISLSKGLGLGWNRIALRWSREEKNDAITIMNKFNMVCRPNLWVGLYFLTHLEPYYFFKKYHSAYNKILKDFDLTPTKTIHIALNKENSPVGLRPLLRYLNDD